MVTGTRVSREALECRECANPSWRVIDGDSVAFHPGVGLKPSFIDACAYAQLDVHPATPENPEQGERPGEAGHRKGAHAPSGIDDLTRRARVAGARPALLTRLSGDQRGVQA